MKRHITKKKAAENDGQFKLVQEVIGVALISLALFSFISLISYNPLDPSLNTKGGIREINNYGGIAGAYLADILFQFFGYASLYIPFFLAAVGVRRFRKSPATHRILKVVCSLLFFLETAVLLQLRWSTADLFQRDYSGKTGGAVGEFLKVLFIGMFNEVGSYILVISLLIMTLLLFTGISIQAVVLWTKSEFTRRWTPLAAFFVTKYMNYRHNRLKTREKNRAETERVIIRRGEKTLDDDVSEEDEDEEDLETPTPARKGSRKKDDKHFVQEEFSFVRDIDDFVLPSLTLLEDVPAKLDVRLNQEINENSSLIVEKFKSHDLQGRVTQVISGPVISRYEFEPDPGIKISRITSLSEDLGLALKSKMPPLVGVVPGKSVIGIEISNKKREPIFLKEIIQSDAYQKMSSYLRLALGKDTEGNPYTTGLDSMPHLLIAGATGAGKSVCIHSIIASLLYSAPPDRLNLLLIDPKMLELSVYNKIPHLREPVVTSAKRASKALQWAVSEMEDRYKILARLGVRDIKQYNETVQELSKKKEHAGEEYPFPMPYLVIIIDELADLMMVSAKDVEESIARLAQMARASGIHLIVSTQRPSVNVLTGIIKANFSSRIAFQVSSKVDSRTILDENGAEKLLGKGDMFFKPPNDRLIRLHGAYVSEIEIQRLVHYVSQFKTIRQRESIFKIVEEKSERKSQKIEDGDDLFEEAVKVIVQTGNASISMLQRRLKIGHSRAARLIDMMEQAGIVGPFEGSKSREVIMKPEDLPYQQEKNDDD